MNGGGGGETKTDNESANRAACESFRFLSLLPPSFFGREDPPFFLGANTTLPLPRFEVPSSLLFSLSFFFPPRPWSRVCVLAIASLRPTSPSSSHIVSFAPRSFRLLPTAPSRWGTFRGRLPDLPPRKSEMAGCRNKVPALSLLVPPFLPFLFPCSFPCLSWLGAIPNPVLTFPPTSYLERLGSAHRTDTSRLLSSWPSPAISICPSCLIIPPLCPRLAALRSLARRPQLPASPRLDPCRHFVRRHRHRRRPCGPDAFERAREVWWTQGARGGCEE